MMDERRPPEPEADEHEEAVEDLKAPAEIQSDVAGGMPCGGVSCHVTCVKTTIDE